MSIISSAGGVVPFLECNDQSQFTHGGSLPHKVEPAKFPMILFRVLNLIQLDGRTDIMCWQPHGRCFIIRKRKELEALLPRYFKSITKYKSLQRQLYNYGFRRLRSTMDKGGYYHEFFLRDRPDLVFHIDRIRAAGSGIRARPETPDPNFYHLPCVASMQADSPVHKTWMSNSCSGGTKSSTTLAHDERELSQESETSISIVQQEWISWIEGDDDEISCAYLKSFLCSFALSESIEEATNQHLANSDEVQSDKASLTVLESRCGYGSTLFTRLDPIPAFPTIPDCMHQVG
jgi:HSF-type DNA-binding